MDRALESLLDALDPDAEDDEEPISFAQLELERTRWKLLEPSNLDAFVLWRSTAGMGGESLWGLWNLIQKPGTAALLVDFQTLNARMARLKRRRKKSNKKG